MKTNINNTPLSYPEKDERNCYRIQNRYFQDNRNLSECDYNVENFLRFLEIAKAETRRGDTRPIYIFDFFERLDEATDIAPFIDLLASLGRQVFIGVGNYPVERFENNDKVKII